MFRVSNTPIITSTQNCNYSLQYGSYFLCSYLPPTWPNLATLQCALGKRCWACGLGVWITIHFCLEQSPPFSAEAGTEWSYTSTPHSVTCTTQHYFIYLEGYIKIKFWKCWEGCIWAKILKLMWEAAWKACIATWKLNTKLSRTKKNHVKPWSSCRVTGPCRWWRLTTKTNVKMLFCRVPPYPKEHCCVWMFLARLCSS